MCPAGGRVAHGVIHRPHHHRPTLLPTRLKPFTSYKFRVKATNDIGDSEYSEESESLTTLQAGQSRLRLLGQGEGVPPCLGIPLCPGHSPLRGHPPVPGHLRSLTTRFSPAAPEEAPTILSVTPHTTTSVLIRWQVLSPLPCGVSQDWPPAPLGGGTEVYW